MASTPQSLAPQQIFLPNKGPTQNSYYLVRFRVSQDIFDLLMYSSIPGYFLKVSVWNYFKQKFPHTLGKLGLGEVHDILVCIKQSEDKRFKHSDNERYRYWLDKDSGSPEVEAALEPVNAADM